MTPDSLDSLSITPSLVQFKVLNSVTGSKDPSWCPSSRDVSRGSRDRDTGFWVAPVKVQRRRVDLVTGEVRRTGRLETDRSSFGEGDGYSTYVSPTLFRIT